MKAPGGGGGGAQSGEGLVGSRTATMPLVSPCISEETTAIVGALVGCLAGSCTDKPATF